MKKLIFLFMATMSFAASAFANGYDCKATSKRGQDQLAEFISVNRLWHYNAYLPEQKVLRIPTSLCDVAANGPAQIGCQTAGLTSGGLIVRIWNSYAEVEMYASSCSLGRIQVHCEAYVGSQTKGLIR